jgi:hypothetical protein
MAYEDFDRFWKVKEPGSEECTGSSIVTFYRNPATENVTVFCAEIPYKEGTGRYNPDNDTIEVTLKDGAYVISMQENTSGTPEIAFAPKGPGPLAGSWTANDYVPPGSKLGPAGE